MAEVLNDPARSRPIAPWRCIGVERILSWAQGRVVPARTTAGGRVLPGKGKLTDKAKLILLMVANFDRAFFSVEYIANLLECGVSTAREHFAELEAVGLIERVPDFTGWGTNTYKLVNPPGSPGSEILAGGSPKTRRPKLRVVKPSDGDGEKTEIKAASTERPDAGDGELEPDDAALRAELEAAAFRVGDCDDPQTPAQHLEPQLEKGDDGGAPGESQRQGARHHGHSPRQPLLDLRRCSSPLLSSELMAALLSLHHGRQAGRLLERSKLKPADAERAVKRLLKYDEQKGVKNAAGLMVEVIRDLEEEAADLLEREQAKKHDDLERQLAEKKRVQEQTKKAAELPVNQHIKDPSAAAKFLERYNKFTTATGRGLVHGTTGT
jgi:hypothetical protein